MLKKQLGQFFTINADYILQGLADFIKDKKVMDPFAGNGDLLDWALKNNAQKVIGFDYDKKLVDGKKIFLNDSLNNYKEYQEYQFVIANPPYLHKNKANQEIKEKFFSGQHRIFEDLYQISVLK